MSADPRVARGGGIADHRRRWSHPLRWALAPAVATLLSGCAATTPAPRFSPVSPADAAAPEAATPPPPPALTAGGDLADPREPDPSQEPVEGHQGHSMQGMPSPGTSDSAKPSPDDHDAHAGHGAATSGARAETYTCPMHPKVEAEGPGSCPICGMPLIKKAPEKAPEPTGPRR